MKFPDNIIPNNYDFNVICMDILTKKKRVPTYQIVIEDPLIGKTVRKQFHRKYYNGTIVRKGRNGFYKINYDDGDSEEFDNDDVKKYSVTRKPNIYRAIVR